MLFKPIDLSVSQKTEPFNKTIEVDSDKSISIRSFLIGAICQKISFVKNALESDDVISTINCLKNLGVKIKKLRSKNYTIHGNGLGSLGGKKNTELNFGNSGTLSRLLVGILSTTPNIELNIKGDRSLNKRSMDKLINLISNFGASFAPKKKNEISIKNNLIKNSYWHKL